MKSFKHIILFVTIIFFIQAPLNTFSQSAAASKVVTKGVQKSTTKAAAKATSKSVTKSAIKSVVKKEIGKEAAEFAVKRGAKTLGKREAKAAIREGAKSAAKKTLMKGSKKTISNVSGSFVSKKIVERKVNRSLTKELLESSMKDVRHYASRKMTKETAQEVEEQLIARLGKSTMEQWRKFVPDATSDANRVLLRDLSENPSFSRVICGLNGKKAAPQLLESYSHCLDAPSVRTRSDVLRYLSNGADLYHEKGLYRKTLFGKGNELRLKEKDGFVEIFKDGSTSSIGKMRPNGRGGFDVEVPFSDRTLLNLFPMKNSSYSTTRKVGKNGYSKNTWITDGSGRLRTTITEVKPDGKFVPLKRDKNAIQSAGRIKKDNTIHGQTPNRPTYINDDSGHMSALQCGGTNDCINLLSQNASLNKGSWKLGEDAARKSINDGKTVKRIVDSHYSDKVDLRPSSFSVNQYVDDVQTISNQFFENVIEVVK